jgi:hypothetical protein
VIPSLPSFPRSDATESAGYNKHADPDPVPAAAATARSRVPSRRPDPSAAFTRGNCAVPRCPRTKPARAYATHHSWVLGPESPDPRSEEPRRPLHCIAAPPARAPAVVRAWTWTLAVITTSGPGVRLTQPVKISRLLARADAGTTSHARAPTRRRIGHGQRANEPGNQPTPAAPHRPTPLHSAPLTNAQGF